MVSARCCAHVSQPAVDNLYNNGEYPPTAVTKQVRALYLHCAYTVPTLCHAYCLLPTRGVRSHFTVMGPTRHHEFHLDRNTIPINLFREIYFMISNISTELKISRTATFTNRLEKKTDVANLRLFGDSLAYFGQMSRAIWSHANKCRLITDYC